MINTINNAAQNYFDDLTILENQRETLQTIISEAQSQIAEAKARRNLTGEFADPNWFAQTQTLIRQETINLHNINRQIKEIRAILNRPTSRSRYFQEAAKKILDKETYNKILELSNHV